MRFARLLVVGLMCMTVVGCSKSKPESSAVQELRLVAKQNQLHWEVDCEHTGHKIAYHVRVWRGDQSDGWWFVIGEDQDAAVGEMTSRVLAGLPPVPDVDGSRNSMEECAHE